MKNLHFGFMKILILSLITFLITTSCDVNEPKKDNPKPEGYQEDIEWPSLAGVPWPMHHGNPQFNGRSKDAGPSLGIIEWQINIPLIQYTHSSLSPVVGKDGTIYYYSIYDSESPNSFLYAISPKGNIKWKYPIYSEKNTSPPIVTTDGKIYLSDWANNVSCLNSDGTLNWRITLKRPIRSIMNIDKNGNLYGIAADGILYSFSPQGEIRWQLQISDFGNTSDAIAFAPDGNTLYLKNRDSGLYAITTSGEIVWKNTDGYKDYIAPLITSQGKIFLYSGMLPINKDGTTDSLLMRKIKDGIERPAILGDIEMTIDKNGNFYIGGSNFIASFDFNGNLRWQKSNLDLNGAFGLVCDKYGKIYFMGNDEFLYCLNSEGTEIWKLHLDGDGSYSPAIFNGRMYLGTVKSSSELRTFYSIK